MANTPDLSSCFSPTDGDRQLLPISPFYALNYHFGMLLGVDDFDTEQAYHRGKMQLHNAWLHREGVVWGLEVKLAQAQGEVRVTRGLALDGCGRELHLEGDACVNLGAWFDKHRGDADLQVTESNGTFSFDAHVVIRHKACLTRQVPALLEPCNGSGTDTAYSRVFETVEIVLMPGKAPDAPAPPYHFLRLLFGLDAARQREDSSVEPADQEILDARNQVLAMPVGDQPAAWLALFRRCAAQDEMALAPAVSQPDGETTLFPALDDEPIVLADILGIGLRKQGDSWLVTAGTVHNEQRPAHVATRTIQELLCAALHASPSLAPDAGGPRVDGGSVKFVGDTVTFAVDRDLHAASVTPQAFVVSAFDQTSGWQLATVSSATYDATTKTVTVKLNAALAGQASRLIAHGTGERPLLGANRVPLAGATIDPPATVHNGKDFVFMKLGS